MSVNDDVIKAGIVSDADYMGRLFRDLQNANDSNLFGVVPLCMAPYFSLIIHEVKGKPQVIDPSVFDEFSADAAAVSARARHSLKLFEDTQRGIEGQLEFFKKDILDKHSAHFLGNTWFPPARRWEKDLGLFTYGGTLLATSHSAAFHLGIEHERIFRNDDGAYVRGTNEQVGRCFYRLGARLDATGGDTFVRHLSGNFVKRKDVRASGYYPRAFNGSTTEALNGVLTDFQVMMNFIDKVITAGADVLNLEYTVFKIRYITVYAVLQSLALLKDDARYPLSSASTAVIENILAAPAGRVITDRSVRHFRNTLMHYNLLPSADTARVDLGQPVFGLGPQYFPAYDFEGLGGLLDTCIQETANALNEWAGGV
ncbi:hypothetical protein F7R91_01690 [Streptomyces luteolifulvus]|uniref:Uncharacterized protein n=1 Tax=Streptomyces luteolifulvus TaxID=2615112 RepID=A0A6H9VB53_9ACTN|nr:hypothetical protein [Streptomyces luteolifulvus]KAB1150717.1 hypothetical protein F7R91_01690 [Streptomyces luteolifulvus]